MIDIRQQIRANEKAMYEQMKAEPKCTCGHARLRHGVFCVTSCTKCLCDAYQSTAAPTPANRETED